MAIETIETQLAAAVSGSNIRIVGPSSDDYHELIIRWSVMAEKRAVTFLFHPFLYDPSDILQAAIALPKTEDEVSQCVKACRDLKLDFVVCGGRHNPAGSSSTENGVVIDMRMMKDVTVDSNAKTITAEGGCLWADVDEEAAKYGLCAVGGTVNHTGVAGLTLGGGFGYLTGLYGLVIDNLLSVRMVLADGRIVTASETENADLFWAVRGSGSNFGVVTSFTFRGNPKPPVVWVGQFAFAASQLTQLVEVFNKLHANTRDDAVLLMAFLHGPSGPMILCTAAFIGPEADGRKHFSELILVEALSQQMEEMAYEKINSCLNPVMMYGDRRAMGGASFVAPLDYSFAKSIFDECSEFVAKNDVPETLVLWEMVPNRKLREVPLQAMAFANRGDYFNSGMLIKSRNQEQDVICREFLGTICRRIREEGGALNKKGVGIYANYVDTGTKPVNNLFGPNMERLLELKNKYDPDNCFRNWHNLKL